MEFTGEFFIPGKTEKRIARDHISRYNFARKYVKDLNVLDIACGVGYGGDIMKGDYASYTGVDINADNIDFAIKNYKNSKSNYITGNILSFSDGPFDIIICFETIEHVREYKQALKELYNNLSAGGILIISSPNRSVTSKNAINLFDPPENIYHTQEFLPGELISELAALGFDKRNIKLFGQRQAINFKTALFRKAYKYFLNPSKRTSSKVKPVKNRTPRYFILLAGKDN